MVHKLEITFYCVAYIYCLGLIFLFKHLVSLIAATMDAEEMVHCAVQTESPEDPPGLPRRMSPPQEAEGGGDTCADSAQTGNSRAKRARQEASSPAAEAGLSSSAQGPSASCAFSPVRSKCVQLLLAALRPQLPDGGAAAELAGDIERHIHELHKPAKYKARVRSKVANLRNPKKPAPGPGPPERLPVGRGLRPDVRGGDGQRGAAAAQGGVLVPGGQREAAPSRGRRHADAEDPLQKMRGVGLSGDAGVQGDPLPASVGEAERPRRGRRDLCGLQRVWAAVVPQRLGLPLDTSVDPNECAKSPAWIEKPAVIKTLFSWFLL